MAVAYCSQQGTGHPSAGHGMSQQVWSDALQASGAQHWPLVLTNANAIPADRRMAAIMPNDLFFMM
jgi:hypothetical protein